MKTSHIHTKAKQFFCLFVLPILFLDISSVFAGETGSLLSLEDAIKQAQNNDPWLVENQFIQDSLDARSIAEGQLPDPVASVSLLNMPTDGFDFNQENMTQLKAGISQTFPRGDTLQLQTKKLQLLSRQNPYLRADRKQQISVIVSKLWLEAFNAKESIRLIEQDRDLFEQLLDVSEVSYSTAFGGTQQQDVVRAQLELTRLEDRLTQLKQQQDVAEKKLSQWISGQFTEHYSGSIMTSIGTVNIDSRQLPKLVLKQPELVEINDEQLPAKLTAYFTEHPAIMALHNRIQASQTQVKLVQQKYKSQWGVNAAYSYRADRPSGKSRADFLSIGINFDLPLFTENKQDKQMQASISEAEAIKTQKWLLLRKMIADFQTSKARMKRLEQRSQLFKQQLLPKIHEQAEAALTAYTNDEGDFAEVVRARIDVLDTEIENLNIQVDMEKTIAELNYYMTTNGDFIKQGNKK